MKKVKLIVAVLVLTLFSPNLFGQSPGIPDVPDDPGWTLEWSDEFDFLDLSKWEVKDQWDAFGHPLVNLAKNVSIYTDGTGEKHLKLDLIREEYECDPQYVTVNGPCRWQFANGPYQYTGGYVLSNAPYTPRYGYIESKIKLTHGYGIQSNYWTFRTDVPTPTNASEIDIFEMLGEKPCTQMSSNLHTSYCDDTSPCWNPATNGCSQIVGVPDAGCTQPDIIYSYFQEPTIPCYDGVSMVWGLKWNPDYIYWYLNGVLIRTSENDLNGESIDDYVRMIYNITVRRDFLPNASTPLPADMLIDYIRVYDMVMDCETVVSTCGFDFVAWDNEVKKSITINNAVGCYATQPITGPGSYTALRATDFILINGAFTVPLGAEMVAETVTCY